MIMLAGSLQVVDEDVEEGSEDPGETEDGEGGDDVASEVAGRGQTAGPPGWLLLLQERILGERQDGVVSLVMSLLTLRGGGAAGAGTGGTGRAPRGT